MTTVLLRPPLESDTVGPFDDRGAMSAAAVWAGKGRSSDVVLLVRVDPVGTVRPRERHIPGIR
jgi:hypothetical protein